MYSHERHTRFVFSDEGPTRFKHAIGNANLLEIDYLEGPCIYVDKQGFERKINRNFVSEQWKAK